ncbi:MAG: hypothetical protein ACRDKY_00450 [Solirubrobacteraceae bacterium]
MELDSRNLGILLGAALLIGALWAPWYVLDISAARDALGASSSPQTPELLGQFMREIVSVLPDTISADAWLAFERGDVILLVAGVAASFAALMDRHEVSTSVGAGAAGLIVVAMINKPGDVPNEMISLGWGPWLALAGALLIVVSSRLGGSEKAADAAPTQVDWLARSEEMERERAKLPQEVWDAPAAAATPADIVLGDVSRSVAPPPPN